MWVLLVVLQIAGSTLIASDLVWEKTQIELTTNVGQESVEASFRFKNKGVNSVTILETRSSCGCTVASLTKKTFLSEDEGELKVVFVVGEYTGIKVQDITVVSSDDPAHPAILTLKVDIPELFQISPKLVIWKSDQIGNLTEYKSIEISACNRMPFAVSVVAVAPEEFETKLVSGDDGRHWELYIRPKKEPKALTKVLVRLLVKQEPCRVRLFDVHGLFK